MGRIEKVLDRIEVIGNKLPDPVTLFVILIAVVFGISALMSLADVSAVNPATKESVTAINLFSADIIQRLLVEMPRTFTSFAPLGTVLVVMLGVGVAEKSGFVAVGLSGFVRNVPQALLTPAVVFAGVMSSLTVDAGYVVLIPLSGILFAAAGRHPIAGIAAAFAGVSAGYSANLLITPLDPLLAGLTQSSGQILEPALVVLPTANYYLMIALVPVFVLIGWWITSRFIEPRLPSFTDDQFPLKDESVVTADQSKGLKYAGLVTLAVVASILFLTVPENAVLREAAPEGGGELSFVQEFGPFLNSLVALIALAFLLIGIAFGIGAGTIKNDKDVVKMTSSTMSDMGLYLVLAFVAAHFIVLFSWSNLGIILAINGADVIRATGLSGSVLVVLLVALAGIINLFIGSATAKWALIGPVLVPMFMLVGLDPEVTQAAYRIGDSITNILTPLMPYFPMVLVFAQRYDKNFGIGSLAAVMLPFSIAFGIGATGLLVAWMLAGIPLGPGLN